MKILFDVAILSKQKFGVAYAVLEQMKALQALPELEVENIVFGINGVKEHRELLKEEGISSRSFLFPNKATRIFEKFKISLSSLSLGKYDFFIQTGTHASRVIDHEKYILSVHDMLGHRYQEEYAPQGLTVVEKQKLMRKVKAITTVSEFTKSEIMYFFPDISHDKIHVIPNGYDQSRFNEKNDLKEFEIIRNRYNLPAKYFLAYGGNSERKNMGRLYSVFLENATPLPLVVFGKHDVSANNNIFALGYLPEKEVELILKNAFALILPSFYEGFGLPVIEAQACGIPVICSEVASLPEVSGGYVFSFNPFDKDLIYKSIIRAYEDVIERKRMVKQGLAWAKEFTWENSAGRLFELLNKLSI